MALTQQALTADNDDRHRICLLRATDYLNNRLVAQQLVIYNPVDNIARLSSRPSRARHNSFHKPDALTKG